MKCREVNELLIAYLDNEVTPSERALIQAHLAGCDACQEELAALSALQSRVSQFLQVRAAQAAPSPQAWSRLQTRLAREARPSPSWLPTWLQRLAPGVGHINQIFGGVTMKKGFALVVIAALVIALGAVAFVPSVRAQAGELLRWFRFESPAGGGEVSIMGSVEFTPLRPAYLPDGFQAMAVGLNPEVASLNYWNSATNQILIIDQQRLSLDDQRTLPPGTRVTINGQPAVLITGLEGSVTFALIPPTPSAPVATPVEPDQVVPLEPITVPAEAISYTDGKQLIWYAGEIRIEMLSNLPEEEMLKIAGSMVPAEEGEGPIESNP
ncbi:MAG: zf-HC2 domain-containing protein [Anaerolineae bacterium]|jgi:anti-sigma factor ChrR (cupin superfamily)|nr:zf-HC2 domain-containing protein [Anaerolineae bacterium]